MNRKEELESLLSTNFKCDFLEVLNESHKHSVPKNSETHFKVTIVTADFARDHDFFEVIGLHKIEFRD